MANPDQPLLFQPAPDPSTEARLTVSQLTALVKRAIQRELPSPVHVVGEISNLKQHKSGHLYFTLKDDGSELGCVMWRPAALRLKFAPQDGMEVIATGEIDVFQRAGRYQLYARRLEPKGVGAFELAFRQLHAKLKQEGLFDPACKQAIPPYPRHIAVVTSPTGAAFRDILQTLRRRFPCVTVSILPVTVQGDKAASEITGALDQLNKHNQRLLIDLIITGRGGGSLEDLWAFNEEAVARAIFRSKIPIISAVGHETDVTISDLVADLRAPTPTAAAELAVPDRREVREQIHLKARRLHRAVTHHLAICNNAIASLTHREPFHKPARLVQESAENLDRLQTTIDLAMSRRLHHWAQWLAKLETTLHLLEPKHFLDTLRSRLRTLAHRGRIALQRRLQSDERLLHHMDQRLTRASPEKIVLLTRQRLEWLERQLAGSVTALLQRYNAGLVSLDKQLQSVSYRRTLARGYSVTRLSDRRTIVTSAASVRRGDVVETETNDGAFQSTVGGKSPEQMSLFG